MKQLLSRTLGRTQRAARPQTPRELYGIVFDIVQLSRTLLDGMTFVDSIPKRTPEAIRDAFLREHSRSMSIGKFVKDNFILPEVNAAPIAEAEKDAPPTAIGAYISYMWRELARGPDERIPYSSLLPLPHRYVVPGGRFRAIFYWDSYFTMLGLAESGELDLMRGMIENFAHLIETYGHIPNGNRSYYLTRSQPPFFAHMVNLLAAVDGDVVYEKYLPALLQEYSYWMRGADAPDFKAGALSAARVVRMPDGEILNRFWDDSAEPREESFAEDAELARHVDDAQTLYRNMRAGAESGWDYSSRWFANGTSRDSIRTVDIVPVDLNAFMYMVEETIARAFEVTGQLNESAAFHARAGLRAHAIEKYFWSDAERWYCDYALPDRARSPHRSLAGCAPLFAGIAAPARAGAAVPVLMEQFLKDGGLVSTLAETGEQWDAPNGWAPLQYIAVAGLERYGYAAEARDVATRWCRTVIASFEKTGTLLEKYNVVAPGSFAGGGEYPLQDGFGWTNGVTLALMRRYGIVHEQ